MEATREKREGLETDAEAMDCALGDSSGGLWMENVVKDFLEEFVGEVEDGCFATATAED